MIGIICSQLSLDSYTCGSYVGSRGSQRTCDASGDFNACMYLLFYSRRRHESLGRLTVLGYYLHADAEEIPQSQLCDVVGNVPGAWLVSTDIR